MRALQSPNTGDSVARGVRTRLNGVDVRLELAPKESLATTTPSAWLRLRRRRIVAHRTSGILGKLKPVASGRLAERIASHRCARQAPCQNARENNQLQKQRHAILPASGRTSRANSNVEPIFELHPHSRTTAIARNNAWTVGFGSSTTMRWRNNPVDFGILNAPSGTLHSQIMSSRQGNPMKTISCASPSCEAEISREEYCRLTFRVARTTLQDKSPPPPFGNMQQAPDRQRHIRSTSTSGPLAH